jgi:hypothetical protein
MKVLKDSGILGTNSTPKWGVKLLASGHTAFTRDFPKLAAEHGMAVPQIEITDVSQQAKDAIETVGGSVNIIWMGKIPLRAHLKPEKFDLLPRGPGIPPRKYRAKYGYVFPEERIYTAADKKHQYPPRVPGLSVNTGKKNWPKPLKDNVAKPVVTKQ